MNTAKPALLSVFTFAILIISTSWMCYPKESSSTLTVPPQSKHKRVRASEKDDNIHTYYYGPNET